jgi:hypothetical protein
MHRDVKPDNICLNPQSGLASLLDFGCMMATDGTDYCRGGSLNYVPPELAEPDTYFVRDLCRAATHSSSDTFLAARVVYEMLLNVPAALNLDNYDPDDPVSFASYLSATRSFNWTPGLVFLHSNGLEPVAQWLAACLVPDPLLRPTPQQALAMPFLQAVAREVDAAVAAATPRFVAGNQAAVQLLQGLEGQDFTFVAHPQQAPSSSNGSSSSCSSHRGDGCMDGACRAAAAAAECSCVPVAPSNATRCVQLVVGSGNHGAADAISTAAAAAGCSCWPVAPVQATARVQHTVGCGSHEAAAGIRAAAAAAGCFSWPGAPGQPTARVQHAAGMCQAGLPSAASAGSTWAGSAAASRYPSGLGQRSLGLWPAGPQG